MTSDVTSTRQLLWLACREKTCCHTTKVIVSGHDVHRICEALSVQPWDFTVYCDAEENAPDGFQLVQGGPAYQMVLAKRGRVGPKGAPCTFLWKLADGHAQCGLGTLRPRVCLAYPAVIVDGTLCADGSACTCRQWSVLDLEPETDRIVVEGILTEAEEYGAMVQTWNEDLPPPPTTRTYHDFCTHLMAAFATGPPEPVR